MARLYLSYVMEYVVMYIKRKGALQPAFLCSLICTLVSLAVMQYVYNAPSKVLDCLIDLADKLGLIQNL